MNFTLPAAAATYVHRVGRTGRAGAQGLAVSLVAVQNELVWFHKCKNGGHDGGCTAVQSAGAGSVPTGDASMHWGRGKKSAACTLWQCETELLGAVSELLGDTEVPAVTEKDLERGREHVRAIAATSRPDVAKAVLATKRHIAVVGPQAQRLYGMELAAQKSALAMRARAEDWREMLRAGRGNVVA